MLTMEWQREEGETFITPDKKTTTTDDSITNDPTLHSTKDDFVTKDLYEITSSEGDIEEDLTFTEARLEVTGLQRTPRVRSYPDLVEIYLMFPDETFSVSSEHDSLCSSNKSHHSEQDSKCNENNCKDENSSKTKNENSDSYHINNQNNNMNENCNENEEDDQSFDCFQFVLLLRLWNSQQQKHNTRTKNTEQSTNNDNTTTDNRKDSKELSKTDSIENLNNWINKMKKAQSRELNPEDWGIELADMAGEGQCCCSVEETCMKFEGLKSVDVWKQISNYWKNKTKVK